VGVTDGNIEVAERMEWTKTAGDTTRTPIVQIDFERLRSRFEDIMKNVILEWIPDRQKRARVTTTLVGIHVE